MLNKAFIKDRFAEKGFRVELQNIRFESSYCWFKDILRETDWKVRAQNGTKSMDIRYFSGSRGIMAFALFDYVDLKGTYTDIRIVAYAGAKEKDIECLISTLPNPMKQEYAQRLLHGEYVDVVDKRIRVAI